MTTARSTTIDSIEAAGRAFRVLIARHPRARRYVLRVTVEGHLRLTVPYRASIAGGLSFARRQHDWIVREWSRLERSVAAWSSGTEIWFRGARVPLEVTRDRATFAGERVPLGSGADVRRTVEQYLRRLAAVELPARVASLAARRHLAAGSVSVRNQRSRWGSCSTRGRIALNWRLIQMPSLVSDYIILHEIARHANHSVRFWREVESLCPWWKDGERWLRTYGKELL
jgi:hypothetical protein